MRPSDHESPGRTEPSPLDDAVRRALEPSSRQVERVLHSARRARPSPSPLRPGWSWAVAAAVLLAVFSLRPRAPEPLVTPRSATTETAVLRLSNAGGLVQIRAGDATRLLVVPASDLERSPR